MIYAILDVLFIALMVEIGVVFALGFWLGQMQIVKLAAVYRIDYRLAYLIPPVVMLIISWTLFRRRSG